uniref:Uncharacterized protein n=1 Tax=Minutocellus polymorphus TaxID=265543 RepID=A0A7S0AGE4_9STRA|mmetsp:Transcript_1249/g.2148  ORF Transcript_1249/g.2148 Transcript_1249/m.2148 type:complete len:356 (+) Transcript_1249:72-1139(+)
MSRYALYPKLWRTCSADEDDDRQWNNETTSTDHSTGLSGAGGVGGTTESFLRARSVPSTDLVSLEVQRPQPRYLIDIVNNSMVVGEEFVLTCLFLARHRDAIEDRETTLNGESKQVLSMVAVVLAAVLIFYNSESLSDEEKRVTNAKKRRKRLLVRASDAIILAAILRFLASVLRTLTASYSSDTVNALAIGGMVVHLLACDYSYALGTSTRGKIGGDELGRSRRQVGRPTFLGGSVSLNAALFSTTLLASRLPTNVMSYAFISCAVVLFAFYPAVRHTIAANQSQSKVFTLCQIITIAATSATIPSLSNMLERIVFFGTLGFICAVSPLAKWSLQHRKEIIVGPWDIVHIVVEE